MACGLKRSQKENQKTFIKHLPNSRSTVLLTFADVWPACEYRITFVERNDLQTLHSDLAVAIFTLVMMYMKYKRWPLHGSTKHALRAMRQMAAQ